MSVTDSEMIEFEDALLRSLDQAKRSEYARVHIFEDIRADSAHIAKELAKLCPDAE